MKNQNVNSSCETTLSTVRTYIMHDFYCVVRNINYGEPNSQQRISDVYYPTVANGKASVEEPELR